MMPASVQKFIFLADLAGKICESKADWKTKFELVFSKDISEAIRETGISVEYCDPDTSYEEDVRAYVSAVMDKAERLAAAFE